MSTHHVAYNRFTEFPIDTTPSTTDFDFSAAEIVSNIRHEGNSIAFQMTLPQEFFPSFLAAMNGLLGISNHLYKKSKVLKKIDYAHSEEAKIKNDLVYQERKAEVYALYDRFIRRGLTPKDSISKTKRVFNLEHGENLLTCQSIQLLLHDRKK
jgi:hypothetical protein